MPIQLIIDIYWFRFL